MRRQRPPAIILKYYLYQATVTFGFFWPVFTIFLLDRGLTFTQIALLNSIGAVIVVIGELPTGYIGDRIGRRYALLVSSLLFGAQAFGFVVAQTFVEFVVVWVVYSLAWTFSSGSGDAWLYDTLTQQLDTDQYTRIRGRGGSVNMWVSAGTMLTAGFLYELEPTLPFIAGGVLNLLGVIVLASMPKNQQYVRKNQNADTFTILDALPVIKKRLSAPPLRSFVLYMALFFGILRVADEFIQPITVTALGFPVASLGPLYAGFSVVAAIASYYAGGIESVLTTRWAVVLIPLLVSVVFIVPLVLPIIALPAFFMLRAAQAVLGTIASGYINNHAESIGRATVLSAVSMVYALFRIPLQPFGGIVADLTKPITALAALGGLFLIGFVVIHIWEAPANETDETRGRPTVD